MTTTNTTQRTIESQIVGALADEAMTAQDVWSTLHAVADEYSEREVLDALQELMKRGEVRERTSGQLEISPPGPLSEEQWAYMQEKIDAARQVDCGIEGCDGLGHVGADFPEDWLHTFASGDVGPIGYELYVHDGAAVMCATEQDAREGMTADDVRKLATELEGAPAKLRTLADELDSRNA